MMNKNSNFDNIMENFEQLSGKEIFTKIWTSPRKIFTRINDEDYSKYVVVLLALSGISRAFGQAANQNWGDRMSIWVILGVCIIAGGLIGWVSYYIYAALISWTGKWLKGEGNTDSILNIMAYAMLPSIVALIFLVPQIGVYGNEMFKADGDIVNAGLISNIFVYLSLFLELAFAIWAIILIVIGVSVVQKFSIGKAILNMLIPLVPFLLIVLAIRMF